MAPLRSGISGRVSSPFSVCPSTSVRDILCRFCKWEMRAKGVQLWNTRSISPPPIFLRNRPATSKWTRCPRAVLKAPKGISLARKHNGSLSSVWFFSEHRTIFTNSFPRENLFCRSQDGQEAFSVEQQATGGGIGCTSQGRSLSKGDWELSSLHSSQSYIWPLEIWYQSSPGNEFWTKKRK